MSNQWPSEMELASPEEKEKERTNRFRELFHKAAEKQSQVLARMMRENIDQALQAAYGLDRTRKALVVCNSSGRPWFEVITPWKDLTPEYIDDRQWRNSFGLPEAFVQAQGGGQILCRRIKDFLPGPDPVMPLRYELDRDVESVLPTPPGVRVTELVVPAFASALPAEHPMCKCIALKEKEIDFEEAVESLPTDAPPEYREAYAAAMFHFNPRKKR